MTDRIDALVKERDELAAVVEKAKNLAAEAGRFREADVDTWVNVYALKEVLYTAPADVLREHDAEKHARMRASESADLERERDELAAVVENAKSHACGVMAQLDSYSWHRHDERFVASTRASAFSAYQALSAAPADALREHDAALIESLAEAWDWDHIPHAAPRVRFWLSDRARQVREGEA